MKTVRLNLESTWVDFFTVDGRVGIYQYKGTSERIMKELIQVLVDNHLEQDKTLGGFTHPYFKDAGRP